MYQIGPVWDSFYQSLYLPFTFRLRPVIDNLRLFLIFSNKFCLSCHSFNCSKYKRSGMTTQEMGRNFNTQTFGKMYLFVICMISRYWFQTKLLLYIAYFLEILGQKCQFFSISSTKNEIIL